MTGAWLVTVAMCTEVLKAMFSRENVQTLRALGTKQCLQFTFSGDILAGNRDYCLLSRTSYQRSGIRNYGNKKLSRMLE